MKLFLTIAFGALAGTALGQRVGYNGPPLGQGDCQIIVTVDSQGRTWSNRFHGWYQTSDAKLKSDVKNGCKEAPISSITFTADSRAPQKRVEHVLELMRANAQPPMKVEVLPSLKLSPEGKFPK
ncbi:MAG: hypothetical protein JSS87_10540 [Acidobacteria bacterium]|nr:hypothetical protein [Acidobacteriota bacterium]